MGLLRPVQGVLRPRDRFLLARGHRHYDRDLVAQAPLVELAAQFSVVGDDEFAVERDDLGFHDRLPLVGLSAIAEAVPRQTGAGSVLLSNAFIAAPKAHPVLARLLAVLPEAMETLPGAPAWWATGPLPFTIVARAAAVTIADDALVAGQAAAGAGLAEVRALCARLATAGGGLLLAWKPWAAA